MTAAVLVGLTVLSRWPLRGRTLFNWDAIQYALATDRFDLAAHRPHPPGYPGYVLAGRAVRGLTGLDANTALIILSIGATALAAIALEAAGREMGGRRVGRLAAALLLCSPLGWFYSETALTYAFDPLISLAGGWFAWLGLRDGRRAPVMVGGLVVGILGAIRPTSTALILPLLVYAGWRVGGGGRHGVATVAGLLGAVGLGTATWGVPLLVESGGLAAFVHTSLQLGDAVSASSAVWTTGLHGLMANSRAVLDGLLLSLGLGIPLLTAALVGWRLVPAGQRADTPWLGPGPALLAVWIGPALLIFCAVHIGQLGYLLFPLPALVLPAAAFLDRSSALLGGGARRVTRGLVSAVLVVDLALFAGSLAPVLRTHDRAVSGVLAAVRSHPVRGTVVLSDPASDGSYRLGLYSLRPFRVLAVGQDRHGRTGELFASDGSAPEYDLGRFDRAGPVSLPRTGDLVALDGAVLGIIGDPVAFSERHLDAGAEVWTATLVARDPALLWGQRIWVHGSDCPCQRYRNNAPRPVRVG